MKKLFFLLTLFAFIGTAIAQVPTISMVKNVGVNGGSTGKITLAENETTITGVSITDGTGTWDSGTPTEITGLVAGDYTFTITYTGGTGTTVTYTQTITQPAVRTLAVTIDEPTVLEVALATSGDAVYCVGEAFTLTASSTTGNGGYTYSWDGENGTYGADATHSITTAFGTNSQTVWIKDAKGCKATTDISWTVHAVPTVTIASNVNSNEVCDGGSAVITATGASSTFSPESYTYDWTDIGTTDDNAAQTVEAGTYTVKVTDGNGCVSSTESITITESGGTAPNLSVTNDIVNSCGGGYVVLSATSSTDGVTYAWTPTTDVEDTDAATTTADVDVATTFTVTVTDGNGCTNSGTVAVTPTSNTLPTVSINSVDGDEVCSGIDIEITADASNGASGYTYAWSYSSGAVADGTIDEDAYIVNETLEANATSVQTPYNYTVVVTDANYCTATATRTINVNPLPYFTATPEESECNSEAKGEITLDIQNGEANYGIVWDGTTDASASGQAADYQITAVEAGNYIVTVTDANGCVYANTAPIVVTERDPMTIGTIAANQFICYNTSGATLRADGFAAPSQGGEVAYAWKSSTTAGAFSGAAIGTAATQEPGTLTATTYYRLTVSYDACPSQTVTKDLTVTVNPEFTYTAISSDVLCNGGTTGEIQINATGGTTTTTGVYNVSWTPANASNATTGTTSGGDYTITGLDNTTYTITVTDSEGCAATGTDTSIP